MSDDPPYQLLDALYATLPPLQCRQKCQECCGPIRPAWLEWARLQAERPDLPRPGASLICPLLDQATGQCTVYAIRPLICRLWGMVRTMECPHGCAPERWLREHEVKRLLRALKRLDTVLDDGCTPSVRVFLNRKTE